MNKLFVLIILFMITSLISLSGQTKMKISFRSFDENHHTFDVERAWFNFGKDTLFMVINGEEAYAFSVNGSYWTTDSPVYFRGKEHTGSISVQFKKPLFRYTVMQ